MKRFLQFTSILVIVIGCFTSLFGALSLAIDSDIAVGFSLLGGGLLLIISAGICYLQVMIVDLQITKG